MGGESSSEENLKIAYAFAACGGFAMTMEHNDPDRVVPETLDDRSDPTATDLPPLDELLGGDAGPAASTQNLEGVMRRHLRHRRRWTTGIAAAVLAAGTGGGVVAAELLATSAPAAVNAPRTTTVSPGVGSTAGPQPSVTGPSANGVDFVPAKISAPSGLDWALSAPALVPATATTANGGTSATGGQNGVVPGVCTVTGCFGDDSLADATHVTRLFDRTVNGIDVRVFQVSYSYGRQDLKGVAVPPDEASPPSSGASSSGSPPSGAGTASSGAANGSTVTATPSIAPSCLIGTELVVEVSDQAAVGEFVVPLPGGSPNSVDMASEDVVGVEEGSPMAVLAVKVGAGIDEVRATFGSGQSDAMAVVDGVAVLVAPVPSGLATTSDAAASVVASNASGHVVEHFQLPGTPSLAEPPTCFAVSPGVAGVAPGSTGTASSGTTSSSSSR
jgi:hypothetical protein